MAVLFFAIAVAIAVAAALPNAPLKSKLHRLNAQANSPLGMLFDRLDVDHDGLASAAEIHAYYKTMDACKLANVSHAVTTVGMYDANNDHFLTYGELAALLPRLAKPVPGAQTPQQIHTSYLGGNSAMLMWVTMQNTSTSQARIGFNASSLTTTLTGSTHTYTAGDGWKGTIHQVQVDNLKTNTRYFYQVGDSSAGFSDVFNFVSMPLPSDDIPQVVGMFGDMGTAIPAGYLVCEQMEADHKTDPFGMMVHVGDIAYASTQVDVDVKRGLPTWELESVWDSWANQVQPLAANIPYMAGVGNHEKFYNFSSYLARFRNPAPWGGSPDNIENAVFWFSLDFGKVHFVFMSTEHSYDPGSVQYEWLVNDLQKADGNRDSVPWVVLTGHRPMYCSDDSEEGDHFPGGHFQVTIEPIMIQYHVDLYVCGHMHMYERIHPVLNGTTMQTGNVYRTNLGIPHVVQGNSGVFEDISFVDPQPAWSAKRAGKLGYGRATFANATHLHYEFRYLDTKKTWDEFWLIKEDL